jgi:glycine dehydrogenase
MAACAKEAIAAAGFKVSTAAFFDTFTVDVSSRGLTAEALQAKAAAAGVNVRVVDSKTVGVSFGEAISRPDTEALLSAFGVPAANLKNAPPRVLPAELVRESVFMTHPVFNSHRSETQVRQSRLIVTHSRTH